MPASFWFLSYFITSCAQRKAMFQKTGGGRTPLPVGGARGWYLSMMHWHRWFVEADDSVGPKKVVNSPWISEKPLHPAGGQRRPPLRRKRKVLSDPPKISVEQLPLAPASCSRFPGSFFCLPILRAPMLKVPVGAVVVAFVIDVVEPADGQDKIIRIIIDVDPRGIQPGTHGL